MEENANMIESLIERTTQYGKTNFELIKLKALDKTSDVVSSLVPNSIIVVFFLSFIMFLSVGLALWSGEILGKAYYGFLLVAAFYGITGILFYFVMHKWVKKLVCNNIIKQVLN
jgi:hypothetical protein